MKRRSFTTLAVGLLVGTSAACKRAQAQEMLLIAGATAMESYTKQLVAAFAKKEAKTTVVVENGGGTGAIIALKRGAIDIATMTRDLTDREDDSLLRNYLVARDGIAIIVNSANPVKSLTVAELRQIFAQDIRSWNAVGGADVPIETIGRESTSHTQRSVRDILLGGDRMPKSRVADSREAMIAAVKERPNAIGFSAFAGVTDEVKLLDVEGIPLSRMTVISGRYPLSRSFFLVLYGSSTAPAERFVTFSLSEEGQGILDTDGLFPVY